MDSEKIIKAWERCQKCEMSPLGSEEGKSAYLNCEYTVGLYCDRNKLIDETIALLKEQEAVKPITEDYMYKCGYCKWSFFSMNPANILSMMQSVKFCPHCGKPIDWEGR